MGQNDLEIYESLRFKEFSQGCEGQAYGMLHAIAPYLLSDFAHKHSLMHIFFRPLFYLGYEDPATPMATVQTYSTIEPNCYKETDALYRYMEENISTYAVGCFLEHPTHSSIRKIRAGALSCLLKQTHFAH